MYLVGNIDSFSVIVQPSNATGPFSVLWSLSPQSSNVIDSPSSMTTNIHWNSAGSFVLSVTVSGICGSQKFFQKNIVVTEQSNNCLTISISNPSC